MDMPRPPVTPHLTVHDAPAAIDFYVRAFGARELSRLAAPDGRRVMHCSMLINGALVMLNDDFPEFQGGIGRSPEKLPASPVTIHLYVDDADAAFDRAVAAGATVTMPLADMFWGDRYGKVRDPFGHEWSIATPTRDPAAT